MNDEINLKNRIDEIYSILDELQYNQLEQFVSIQKNQSIIVKKLNQLLEHGEIVDMANSIFDRKLNNIEKKI